MSRRLISYSPKLIFSREPPVNVRGVSENHETVKQTDSGSGVDAQESLGSPLSSEALLNSSLPHDPVMGDLLWRLLAGVLTFHRILTSSTMPVTDGAAPEFNAW